MHLKSKKSKPCLTSCSQGLPYNQDDGHQLKHSTFLKLDTYASPDRMNSYHKTKKNTFFVFPAKMNQFQQQNVHIRDN